MKKRIGLITLLAVVALCFGAIQETTQLGYNPLRTAVTADDTALDGTTESYTYAFADKPADVALGGKSIKVHPYWNNAQIVFTGTDAADETCNFKLYAYRENGPATLVCYGSFTLGTAKTGGTNEYYADTIAVTSVWPETVVVSDSANNRVASLSFDLIGHYYLYCEIDIPAASQVASAGALISGF